ncbi:hypothetical protein ACIQ7D_09740 [Streptomyces sp. NPDC096310]|uniref:hypothetical protein n=1 Tax=Streptomyces sp. NPDC096310 TaxID=3366082 RepID=UPI003818BFA5
MLAQIVLFDGFDPLDVVHKRRATARAATATARRAATATALAVPIDLVLPTVQAPAGRI